MSGTEQPKDPSIVIALYELGLENYAKEVAGYKAQVAGQAEYIRCLLDEIRELKERIAEFVKGD